MGKTERAAAGGTVGETKTAASWLLTAFLLAGSLAVGAEPRTTTAQRPAPKSAAQKLEDKWGIQVESIRLSAHGYLVDFRYKVLDPEKAAALGDPEAKVYLVDRTTGAKLHVPRSPKVGPLRQSAESLTAGKVYFAMFSNKGKAVKAGSKVTVVIGDFKAENLAVQ